LDPLKSKLLFKSYYSVHVVFTVSRNYIVVMNLSEVVGGII